MRLALLAGACVLALASARAAEPADAGAATADLYARISARDLAGLTRYLPADGFTELGTGPATPHRLDAAAFTALFGSGAQLALRATELQVQPLGDAVVVTGVRIGSITPPGAQAVEMAAPFTMVWTQAHGQWQLRHVHLSTPEPVSH